MTNTSLREHCPRERCRAWRRSENNNDKYMLNESELMELWNNINNHLSKLERDIEAMSTHDIIEEAGAIKNKARQVLKSQEAWRAQQKRDNPHNNQP